jgi:hypothetical protein
MTDEELMKDYLGLHAAIYAIDCYSCGDLARLQWAEAELERRGYTIEPGYAPPVVAKPVADEDD